MEFFPIPIKTQLNQFPPEAPRSKNDGSCFSSETRNLRPLEEKHVYDTLGKPVTHPYIDICKNFLFLFSREKCYCLDFILIDIVIIAFV